jgi:hypothetical protein
MKPTDKKPDISEVLYLEVDYWTAKGSAKPVDSLAYVAYLRAEEVIGVLEKVGAVEEAATLRSRLTR